MKKLTSVSHWMGYLILGVINMLLSTSACSYSCGIDNYGFIYTCCAQYTCRAGTGNTCQINIPTGNLAVTGYTTPMWMKTSTCTTAPGWQASTVCTIPLKNSLVTRPCLTQEG